MSDVPNRLNFASRWRYGLSIPWKAHQLLSGRSTHWKAHQLRSGGSTRRKERQLRSGGSTRRKEHQLRSGGSTRRKEHQLPVRMDVEINTLSALSPPKGSVAGLVRSERPVACNFRVTRTATQLEERLRQNEGGWSMRLLSVASFWSSLVQAKSRIFRLNWTFSWKRKCLFPVGNLAVWKGEY
jgi:hypothetical protein